MSKPGVRVVVLGGYGVFGALLCELLVRDGHSVWIAGRDAEKAGTLADRLGAAGLQVDRSGDLSALWAVDPQVVVDAAGPFHAYGEDPYLLVHACIEQSINYLDLSDDASFTAGIGDLDDAARKARVFAISGVSSVPAISSSVAAMLSRGLTDLRLIESAILPGNRAPRGRSVIASILNQMGRSMRVWRGGLLRDVPSWSDRRLYDIGDGVNRAARLITVPDLVLFPAAFGARSALFRAGLELRVMNLGLVVFGLLRRIGLLAPTERVIGLMQRLAGWLEPLGTDLGGMVVDVVGDVGGKTVRRRWQLTAAAGDGPYIPGIAVRTLLRRCIAIAPGARACVAEAEVAEIEQAMSDLAIRFQRSEADHTPLFQRVLGQAWARLPAENRRLADIHDVESFSGRAKITRGNGQLAGLGARLFGFPRSGDDVPITVTKTRSTNGETWERNFDGRRFRSHLAPTGTPGHVTERFGPVKFELDLPVADGEMQLPVLRGWCLGLPIPRVCLPGSESREFTRDGVFHFDVGLYAPFGLGLVVRYQGWLIPDAGNPP